MKFPTQKAWKKIARKDVWIKLLNNAMSKSLDKDAETSKRTSGTEFSAPFTAWVFLWMRPPLPIHALMFKPPLPLFGTKPPTPPPGLPFRVGLLLTRGHKGPTVSVQRRPPPSSQRLGRCGHPVKRRVWEGPEGNGKRAAADPRLPVLMN